MRKTWLNRIFNSFQQKRTQRQLAGLEPPPSTTKVKSKRERQAELEGSRRQKELNEKFSSGTRQLRRQRAFREAWKVCCQRMGGGPGWTGVDLEPRKARRRIARRWAKYGIPEQ